MLDAYRVPQDKMEVNKAAREISTLGKYLMTWTLDNSGAFPPDLDKLASVADSYGIDVKWLENLKPGIIENRRKNLSNSDAGRLVLVRYRPGQQTKTEVRLHVG